VSRHLWAAVIVSLVVLLVLASPVLGMRLGMADDGTAPGVAVVAVSFVLLMIVFRSVLVPLKAAVMNMLSIGTAYGVVVAVFQWGWQKGWSGSRRPSRSWRSSR
jgi:uncharacterized membrane protein YdfJ with MMPL/SSD domain